MTILIATLLSLAAFAHEPGTETEGKPFTPRCQATFQDLRAWSVSAIKEVDQDQGEQCLKQVQKAKKRIPPIPQSCQAIPFYKMPESFQKKWLENENDKPEASATLGELANAYQNRQLQKLTGGCKAKMTGLKLHLQESRAVPHASPDPR